MRSYCISQRLNKWRCNLPGAEKASDRMQSVEITEGTELGDDDGDNTD